MIHHVFRYGGESNEAALRMAKMTTGGFEVVGFDRSWHGVTGGAAASTYSGARQGYGPTLPGSLALPTPDAYRSPFVSKGHYNWREELDYEFQMLDRQSVGRYAAFIAEPILSAAGIIELPAGCLALQERARGLGSYMKDQLLVLQRRHENIGDVRGRGLLLGVELVEDRDSRIPARELGVDVSRRCLELGASLNIGRRSNANIFRIAPPLTVNREQIDTAISIFDQALAECAHRSPLPNNKL